MTRSSFVSRPRRRIGAALRLPACAFFVSLGAGSVLLGGACVPSGSNAGGGDAGTSNATAGPTFRASLNIMQAPFEDNFDRAPIAPVVPVVVDAGGPVPFDVDASFARENMIGRDAAAPIATLADAAQAPKDAAAHADAAALDAAAAVAIAPTAPAQTVSPMPPAFDAGAKPIASALGPNWETSSPNAWRIEDGKLCSRGARNHPVWLKKTLPINARIEFDAQSDSTDGDVKCEVWGDGTSFAKGLSYSDATSYLFILGGWKNTIHALARLNEHGNDRKELHVDPTSDDLRMHPVAPGQIYHFKVERTDGRTVRWYVNGLEYLVFNDSHPLAGAGHDHFGFNGWDVRVCFDNVKVTPL